MSRLPAHIIEEIKRRKRQEQEEKRPQLDLPVPPPLEPEPESPPMEEPKKDGGVVIIDLSIGLDMGIYEANVG